MKAIDSDGYSYSFDKGKWHPDIAKDSEGRLYQFHAKKGVWEKQLTGDERMTTPQKAAIAVGDAASQAGDFIAGAAQDVGDFANKIGDTLSHANQTNFIPADTSNINSNGNDNPALPQMAGTDARTGYVEQKSGISDVMNPIPNADGSFGDQPKIQTEQTDNPLSHGIKMIYAGWQGSGKMALHDAGNIAQVVNDTSKTVAKVFGLHKKDSENIVENFFKEQEKSIHPGTPITIADNLNYIAGSLPAFIAELMGIQKVAKVGMVAAGAIQGALHEYDKGAKATVIGGIHGAAMMRVLEAANTLSVLPRSAALGAAGAADNPNDPVGGAAVMAGLGVMGGTGGRTTLESGKDFIDTVKQDAPADVIDRAKFIKPASSVALDAMNPNQRDIKQPNEGVGRLRGAIKQLAELEQKPDLTDGEKVTQEILREHVQNASKELVARYGVPKETKVEAKSNDKPKEKKPVKKEKSDSIPQDLKAKDFDGTESHRKDKLNSLTGGIYGLSESKFNDMMDSPDSKVPPEFRAMFDKDGTDSGIMAEIDHATKVRDFEEADKLIKQYQDRVKAERDRVFTEPTRKAGDNSPVRTESTIQGYALTPKGNIRTFKGKANAERHADGLEVVPHPTRKGMFAIAKAPEKTPTTEKKTDTATKTPVKGDNKDVNTEKEKRTTKPVTESQVPEGTGDSGVPESTGELRTILDKMDKENEILAKNDKDYAGDNNAFGQNHIRFLIKGREFADKVGKTDKLQPVVKRGETASAKDVRKAIDSFNGYISSKKTAQPSQTPKQDASKKPRGNADFAQDGSTHGDPETSVPDSHIAHDAFKLHELVELAQILTGKVPKVMTKWQSSLRGLMQHNDKKGEARIMLNSFLAKDPKQALKTLAHEIGHVVGWLDAKTLKLGNILGHVANVKKYMKHYLAESPDATEGPLTPADLRRLRKEAVEIAKANYEKKALTEITEDYKITAEDVRNIWNNIGKSKVPGLEDYIKKASSAEKVSIAKEAMKGLVAEQLQRIVRAANELGKGKTPSKLDLADKDIFDMLLKDEIARRRLFNRDILLTELKALSMEWRPFKRGDKEYDKYRDSPAELYADAVSVFFNNPEMLYRMAPEFFRGFKSWATNRPQAFSAIDAMLKSRGSSYDRVWGRIHKHYEHAAELEQIEHERKIKLSEIDINDVTAAFIDRYMPVIDLIKKIAEIKDEDNPVYAIDALTHANTRNEGYLADFTTEFKKVKAPLEAIGDYLLSERVVGEYNAGNHKFAVEGIDYKDAKKRIKEIDNKYGNEVSNFTKRFREIRNEWIIDRMKGSGLWTESTLKSFEREIEHYATFKNIDFIASLDNHYTGGTSFAKIHRRMGSFGGIENPLLSTIAQDLHMIVAGERNRAVMMTVKALNSYDIFKGEIRPAEKHGKKQSFVELSQKSSEALILFMDEGVMQGYYVPKNVANAFKENPNAAELLTTVLAKTGGVAKMLFTEANPAFWTRNVERDYFRTIRNLPGAGVMNYVPLYLKAIAPSFLSAYGIETPIIKDMQKNFELISVADYRSMNDSHDQTGRLLNRFNSGSMSRLIDEPLKKLWYYYSGIPRGSERINKVAARMYLDKHKPDMSKEERRHTLLGEVGSPDFLRAGNEVRLYNNLFLFSNAIKEGMRSDYSVMKKRPLEFFFKMGLYSVLPRVIMGMTMAGQFDTEDSKPSAILRKQSKYSYDNYLMVPLGITDHGEGVVFKLAPDPTDKFFGLLLQSAYDGFKDKDWQEMKSTIMGAFQSEIPGLNPIVQIAKDIGDYSSDINFKDYRGRDVFSYAAMKQNPVDPSLRRSEWLKYEWNSYLSLIARFDHNKIEKDRSEISKALHLPFVGNVARAVFGVSDTGEAQRISKSDAKVDARTSIHNTIIMDALIRINNGKASDDDYRLAVTAKQMDKSSFKRMKKKIALSKMTPMQRALYKIRNSPEKKAAAAKSLRDF